MNGAIRSAAALALLAAHAPAQATVTCNGANASLNLGIYGSLNATPVDSSGSFVVSCRRTPGGPGNSATITVSIGPSATSGSVATRQAGSGANRLNYNLYTTAARATVWGQTPPTDTVTQGTGVIPQNATVPVTFTIFGRIDALQDVPAGAYADQLVVPVTF